MGHYSESLIIVVKFAEYKNVIVGTNTKKRRIGKLEKTS